MEQFDYYLRYTDFKKLLTSYDPNSKTSSGKYKYQESVKEKIEDSLFKIFKELKKTDFISDPDFRYAVKVYRLDA